MDKVVAKLEHSLPGRLRLRLEPRPGPDVMAGFAGLLSVRSEVREVRTNARTGSVLVVYDGNSGDLLRHLEASEFVTVAQPAPHRALARIRQAIDQTDQRVTEQTRGALSLTSASFFGLLGLGAWQAGRGHFFPAGMTLVNYAIELLYRAPLRDPRPKPASGRPA
jgi:hypothetical protein